MSEVPVGADLVGQSVCNAARPEWGVGRVLSVQPARIGDKPAQRVSIQFATGHRTVLVPPARLVTPGPEPQRQAGWLDGIGKSTLDDRLRALPAEITEVLGTPLDRLAAIIPLYAVSEENKSLLRWARDQTGIADPLSQWTRDELLVALRDFRNERDAYLRGIAARIKQKQGPDALQQALASIPDALRPAIEEALARPL
jgi:hypothetical protein